MTDERKEIAPEDHASGGETRIGDVLVSFGNRTLRRNGRDEHLQPRLFDVLQHLAKHRGHVVAKEALIEEVWGDKIVSDESIHRCISKLRKLLGDDAREPKFIITVPKVGYRLALPEPEVATPSDFEKAGDNKDAMLNKGWVASLQSTSHQRWAALVSLSLLLCLVTIAAFGTGSAGGSESRAAVDYAQSRYEQANDLYLQYDRDSNERAIEILLRLAELEEAPGHTFAALAKAYAQKYARWTRNKTDIKEALRYAALAVEKSDNIAESHWAMGIAQEYAGALDEALNAYRRAHALDATIWQISSNIGDIYVQQDEDILAIDYYQKALKHAPLNLKVTNKLGEAHTRIDNIESAAFWFQSALAIDPLNDRASAGLANLAIAAGDYAEAKTICGAIIARISDHPNCRMEFGRALMGERRFDEAFAHFSSTRSADAPKLVSREKAYLLAAAINTGRVADHQEALTQFHTDLKDDAFIDADERERISGILNGEI